MRKLAWNPLNNQESSILVLFSTHFAAWWKFIAIVSPQFYFASFELVKKEIHADEEVVNDILGDNYELLQLAND